MDIASVIEDSGETMAVGVRTGAASASCACLRVGFRSSCLPLPSYLSVNFNARMSSRHSFISPVAESLWYAEMGVLSAGLRYSELPRELVESSQSY